MHSSFIFVTGETVKFINKNVIPRLFCTIFEHTLKIFTIVICSRHSTVNISIDNNYIVTGCKVVTNVNLTFNTSVRPEGAPVEMNVDRPYFFFIADRNDMNILFAGKIVNL